MTWCHRAGGGVLRGLGGAGAFCLPGGTHRAAVNTLVKSESRVQDARRTSRPTGKSL